MTKFGSQFIVHCWKGTCTQHCRYCKGVPVAKLDVAELEELASWHEEARIRLAISKQAAGKETT